MSSTKIPDGIFGDWKTFTIKQATMSDFGPVAEQIRINFLKNEVMNTFLSPEEANKKDHDHLVRITLAHELSFMISRKDTSEVVGVNLVLDNTKPGYGFEDFTPTSNNLRAFMEFLGGLENAVHPAFTQRFKTERYAEMFMTSVSQSYNGQGIAQELYKRGLIFLKAKGLQSVKGVFTGVKSQAVASRMGFQELGRVGYKNYRDKSGKQVFAVAPDDSFAVAAARAL